MQQRSLGLKAARTNPPKGALVVNIVQTCSLPTNPSLSLQQLGHRVGHGISFPMQTLATKTSL